METAENYEKCVINVMLNQPELIDEITAIVQPEDFSNDLARTAFTLAANRHAAGEVVEFRWLLGASQGHDGMAAFLASSLHAGALFGSTQYARRVRDLSLHRALQKLTADFASRMQNDVNAEEVRSNAAWLIAEMERSLVSGRDTQVQTIGHYAGEAIRAIEESMQTQSQMGLPTGLMDIDLQIGGLFPGELTTIAARPGWGKTALGIQLGRHIATKGKLAVIFSIEMTGPELAQRSLCSMAEVNGQRIRNGATTPEDFKKLQLAAEEVSELSILIEDRSDINVQQIAAACRVIAASSPIGIIVVDYVQIVKPTSFTRSRNRAEQVSEIMKGLKSLAKEQDCPVIALAQVNRDAAKEGWLKLHHLKESGSIEEDSNSVWFIQRTETDNNLKVEIDVAKNRNGQVGVTEVCWDPEFTRFRDREVTSMPNYEHEFREWS